MSTIAIKIKQITFGNERGASNNGCIGYILYATRWRQVTVKNVFLIEPFIQKICSQTLIHPVMKHLLSHIHSKPFFK